MKKVKRLAIFNEFSNGFHPDDIPLGLPRFEEYSKLSREESSKLLKKVKRLRWIPKTSYEAEYLRDFIKSLKSVIYIRSHPEETVETYYI
ncbi:MAG: hypothetical protein E7310_03015 [Clostridiales bacterium]|nr:hypothetical protein [Clostridiales bacterium]